MLRSLFNPVRAGAIACLLGFGAATPSVAETLADALADAYRESGLLEQNRATLRAADEDVADAVSALRPVFRWQGNVTRQFGTTGRESVDVFGNTTFRETGTVTTSASLDLVAELTLYDGGQTRLGVDLAKELVLAARAGLVSTEQQVLFRAVQAFMEVRRASEIVELRRNNVRVISTELRAARDRFEVGDVTRTDVALAEARQAEARSALTAADGDLALAREEYRAVTGSRPGGLVPVSGLPPLPPESEARLKAMRSHPEMDRAQRRVTAAELSIVLAEARTKPTVQLQGRYGVTEQFQSRDFSRGGSIGLNAGGPIYSGGALASAVRKARAERDSARGQLHEVQRDIEQALADSYARLRVFSASRTSFEAQVEAATIAFRGVREEATLGARTTLDVLDAEQDLLDARANLVTARIDERLAAYAVLSAMGDLTAEALQLDVKRYDPAEYYNLVNDAPAGLSRQGRQLDRVLRSLGKE